MTTTRRTFLAGAAATGLHGLTASTFPAQHRSTVKMIDAHVHVYKHDPSFPFAVGATVPEQDYPVESLIALMRANGVSHTVIVQIIHYKWDNRYLASVLKRYPRLFHGVCRVNPEDPNAPDHLSQLTQDRFRGVRLSPTASAEGDWIRRPLMQPLWRRCAELKVPMTLLIPVSRISDIRPLIEANPDLDVIIDHMAGCPLNHPDQLALLTSLARFPRVYIKISELWMISTQPYPYADTKPRIQRLIEAFGANRLMWATNWPVSLQKLTYRSAVALYRDHMEYLSASEREAILSGTVQRLWPFSSEISTPSSSTPVDSTTLMGH